MLCCRAIFNGYISIIFNIGHNSRSLHFYNLFAFRVFIIDFMLGGISGGTAGINLRGIRFYRAVYIYVT